MTSKSIGTVETRYFTFAESGNFKLESGRMFGPITLAYETYGKLNAEKSNAILVMHAFSGNAHAAGVHTGDQDAAWWDFMIGPGKALDTDKYFMICVNVIGGCKGSTGPSSPNPNDPRQPAGRGKPYGIDFPLITIGDMVRTQKILIDHLGISRLQGVIGGSMGGMLALQWVASFPDSVECVIPIAATLKHSPQQIAFNEVGRQAIMADPAWNGGHYYEGAFPEKGLAVARMLGHITYMSNDSMEKKFSRRLKDDHTGFKFSADFEVEGYLQYRGMSFTKRFDANTYLYITKAMDYFDLSDEKWIPEGGLPGTRFLVIAFKSDWLYPSVQSQEMVKQLQMRRVDATYCESDSTYGHDTFLIESEAEKQSHLIRHFLAKRKA